MSGTQELKASLANSKTLISMSFPEGNPMFPS